MLTGTVWESAAGFARAIRVGDRVLVSGTTATHGTRLVGGDDAEAQTHAAIDKVAGALDLSEASVAASRGVLRDAGNMSSATVLFVLERLMDPAQPGPAVGEAVAAMAFGPGLTVDGALFRAVAVP